MYDAIVVGGGPAGLSAALVLGRCRRTVLVLDAGQPRNFATRQIHGFLTRDGVSPQELLRLGRIELARYAVEIREAAAEDARREEEGGFAVTLAGGEKLNCRALLLATGVLDRIPDVPGMAELFGRGVFHCAYCDGWEVRDQPVAVYGRGKPGAALAVSLLTWTQDVILCTDGGPYLRPPEADLLERNRIPVRSEKIARLEGNDGLERVVFRNGAVSARKAMFLATGQTQRSPLAVQLGCELNERGAVRTTITQATGIEGLFVAGDICHDVQFVIVAAAEGARAAVAINRLLQGNGE